MNAPAQSAQSDAVELAAALRAGQRAALARAITLIESSAAQHQPAAQALLSHIMPHSGQSIRLGLTGPPGAGKSSFIDALGCALIEAGQRVAVLAIDPSSAVSGGSILGDKTRMARLARADKAFIRPSPTSGLLGGVAGKTREAILLCEAAGYTVVIVETVGTGQSEVALRGLVDFLLLLLIPGAGDELQGIKKGVMEIADALVINKADDANIAAAQAARAQFQRALRFVAPATAGWQTRVFTASALTGAGIDTVESVINEFVTQTKASGIFDQRRQAQRRQWLHAALAAQLRQYVYAQPALQAALPDIEAAVLRGELLAPAAAAQLLRLVLPE